MVDKNINLLVEETTFSVLNKSRNRRYHLYKNVLHFLFTQLHTRSSYGSVTVELDTAVQLVDRLQLYN